MDPAARDAKQLSTLAEQLVAESACELTTDSGQVIEVWLISADGVAVSASASRLAVRAGMQLNWRTHHDGVPTVVTMVVDDAAYQSERRARILLRLETMQRDGAARRHTRRSIAVSATLTAVHCDRIVDNDIVPATVVDISDAGLGLHTADRRPRPGDRFRVDIHSLGAQLRADVRVMRVSPLVDGVELGCSVITDGTQVVTQIARIVARLRDAPAA